MSICIAKSVPNSGIPRVPKGQPPMSSGRIFKASVFWNRDMTSISSRATFVGSVSEREKIVDYYAAADLFVFPSLYDNAPLVVREAAALHTPAVMARGATAATIIRDGENGFLTDNDPDRLAELLRKLIHDPERVRRAGVQASKSIVRSWEDCLEEVIDRYNVLLRSRGLAPLERMA